MRTDPDFVKALKGYGLTTLDILYGMPDHLNLVQSFTWQFYDVDPEYPRATRFIEYWKREIAALLREVRLAHSRLIAPAEWKNVTLLTLH